MQVVIARLDIDPNRRAEALADFLAISLPSMDEGAVKSIAAKVPQIPQKVYEKWIHLFIDRLLETIPQEQLDYLCDGTQDNNITLGMVYLLFMESARMEAQVAKDLAELGIKNDSGSEADAEANALSVYLKARLRQKTDAK